MNCLYFKYLENIFVTLAGVFSNILFLPSVLILFSTGLFAMVFQSEVV